MNKITGSKSSVACVVMDLLKVLAMQKQHGYSEQRKCDCSCVNCFWGSHCVQAATLKAKRQLLTSIDLLVHVADEGTQPCSCDPGNPDEDTTIVDKVQLLQTADSLQSITCSKQSWTGTYLLNALPQTARICPHSLSRAEGVR